MKFFLLILLLFPLSVLAQEDDEIKGLQWNRYTTQNFVILSLDNDQGKWLSQNIEAIKTQCLTRWGFPDNRSFAKECRIFCVPTPALLDKFFNLTESKVEIRKELTVMWLVTDNKSNVFKPLTDVCFAEFEEKNNVKIGFWFKNGSASLNNSEVKIKQHLVDLYSSIQKDKPMFDSEKIFNLTEEEYRGFSSAEKQIFDNETIALCLLLRKEFGEVKLQGFLRLADKNNPQTVLQTVYGFDGYSHFDKQYIRFMRDLTNDINQNKTPGSYLTVTSARR